MDKLKFVTYCGLYCDLCSSRCRTPFIAKSLRDLMLKEGYKYWGKELPGFKEFWKFLSNLCNPDKNCPGCHKGGGPPFYSTRKCAKEKKVDVCVFCDEYPFNKIQALAKGYVTLIADGKIMKEIGIDEWIKEQKERANTGFAYVDIRHHPYEVPSD